MINLATLIVNLARSCGSDKKLFDGITDFIEDLYVNSRRKL